MSRIRKTLTMASKMEEKQYGYDEQRFEVKISHNYLCSICLNVLKEPKTCENNEHVFCHECIAEHLSNFQTCPECMQYLTPETLKPPPRLFLNCLSELSINCNYHSRGCPAIMELGNLQSHVDNCEYAPVKCGNEGCEVEINAKDKDHHEKFFCKFAITVCHNCEELKLKQLTLQEKLEEMTQTQAKVITKVDQIQDNLDEIKETQADIQWHLETLEAKMCQQLETVRGLMENKFLPLVLQGATAERVSTRPEVIICGGYKSYSETTRTAETSSLPEVGWSDIAPMTYPRGAAASCVRGNDLIVTGGCTNYSFTNTIEMLKLNQRPRRWTMLNAKLPANFFGHRVVVYQGKLLLIGGYNNNALKPSNGIYKIFLVPPYSINLLYRMPQPRVFHRVEFVNGKLFILGGSPTTHDKDALDSVLVYDVEKKECQLCSPLPYAVHHMSTVLWGNNIILLGGTDLDGNDLNEVTMYNTETQTSTKLPSMKYKRRGSSAVIFYDRIFVMGGRNDDQGYLSSVESLTIGDNHWQEHENLGQPRHVAIAHGFNVPV